MLQAKTYLFCAIRPEVCFQKYTFATLQFAANASVIRLKPKMATTNQSKREMQLLEELERMRKMIEELQKQKGGKSGQDGINQEEMARLLAQKQNELRKELEGQQQVKRQQEFKQQKENFRAKRYLSF